MSRTWVGIGVGSGWTGPSRMTGASIRSTSLGRAGGTMRCIGGGGTGLTAVGSIRTGLGIPESRALGVGGTAAIMRTGRGMPDGRIRGAAQICIGSPLKQIHFDLLELRIRIAVFKTN